MTFLLRAWICAFLCVAWLTHATPARAEEVRELRRFVLLVSANDGGPKRPLLKHADHDAQTVASVLRELGGVRDADLVRLTQPTKAGLESALASVAERLAAAAHSGVRSEFLFYYSGHSDEFGLLLGGREFAYAELRARLQSLPADVRVAILDSCASGAFTREKGGKLRPPFMLDASTDVRGHAFLTSASEDEAAQESDRVGGSFFTHFLVSGLRGAADSSSDGKVTLTEAYQYAFDETLANTSRTHYGAQHPAYDIRLVGTGDLVLTDLRTTSAELKLAADLEGRLMLREASGRLLLEVYKRRGKETKLGVPAGAYEADLSHDGKFYQASLSTRSNGSTLLTKSAFAEMQGHLTRARGAVYYVEPAAAALVEALSSNPYADRRRVLNHLNLSLVYDRPAALHGIQFSLGAALVEEDARGFQLAPFAAASTQLSGLQLSAVGYVSQDATGLMLGGLTALATGQARGVFVAPFVWAKELSGLQIGAVNAAGNVRGMQLGFINLAASEVRGLQVGLFNYARKADVSLAPIAYTKHGGAHLQYEVTDTGFLSFALRLDATYNYSFVSVRAHPMGETRRGYAIGAGLGAKFPLWREVLFLDADFSFHVLQPQGAWYRGVPNFVNQLRVLLRYQLHLHFSLFAGPALSVLVQTDPMRRADVGFGIARHTLTNPGSDVRVALWPGFAAGLRF